MSNGTSEKSGVACLLFLLLLSLLGIHRFYVGKVGTGVLFLLTGGGFGIWWLIDLIMLISGSFTDSDGAVVKLGK
jgi:TM2 domain-containing membrane protein YozV